MYQIITLRYIFRPYRRGKSIPRQIDPLSPSVCQSHRIAEPKPLAREIGGVGGGLLALSIFYKFILITMYSEGSDIALAESQSSYRPTLYHTLPGG